MVNYTSHFGSNFPNSIIEKKEFKNIDADVLPYITEYFEAMMSNDFNKAQDILDNSVDETGNHVDLDPYMVNAFIFNWLFEEVYNTQIYALEEKKIITYVDSIEDLPDIPIEGHIYRVKRG